MNEQPLETHAPSRFSAREFLLRDWPYIAMLILALIGVALASITLDPMTTYWQVLVPLFAAVCVWTRLRDSQQQKLLWRLIRIEALHWGAVLLAMQLAYVPDVARILNANALALMMLTILALGTFTAGAQIGAWRISVVGVVLGLGVPFVAWLDRATLLITLLAVALAALGSFMYLHHRHATARPH